MNYSDHLAEIRKRTNAALVKETEFNVEFPNPKFARDVMAICINETNVIREKFHPDLCFGFRFYNQVNASATIENGNTILFNHQLVIELENIIRNRITVYFQDRFTAVTNIPIDEEQLFIMFTKISVAYLFYHEWAHIFQLNKSSEINELSFQEQYDYEILFNIKRHIYELDADLLGVSFGTAFFMGYTIKDNRLNNPAVLFHLLTLYIGILASLFISFSGRSLMDIYFKKHSHPDQVIRVFGAVEQILFSFTSNVKYTSHLGAGSPFSNTIIRRAYSMLDLLYSQTSTLRFFNIVEANFQSIAKYTDEIEKFNESFPELTRHSSDSIYKTLAYIQ